MKNFFTIALLLICSSIFSQTIDVPVSVTDSIVRINVVKIARTIVTPPPVDTPPPVQPMYEGFGSNTKGGAGKDTVWVTNTKQSGAGSLIAALGSNRIVAFKVSGTVILRWEPASVVNLTIDGSTAPGAGITINNNNNGPGFNFDNANCHDVIIKNIRVRNAGTDNICIANGAYNFVIDHVSSSGAGDGNIDIANDAHDVTVQYCILGGGKAGWGGAMLITGNRVSIHHNLFLPATANEVGERCPMVHANYSMIGAPNADVVNNIIWRYGRNNGTGSGVGIESSYNATVNAVNNFVQATNSGAVYSNGIVAGAYGQQKGKLYAVGNVSGNGINANAAANVTTAWPAPAITTQTACVAAAVVLANAGPRPLAADDLALVNQVSLANCR